MGLSDEERIRNIIVCVNHLTDITPFSIDLNDNKSKQINDLLSNLWFDLFGREGNSFHWFAGSSSESITLKQDDIFGLAMISSYESDQPKDSLNDTLDPDSTIAPGTKEWWDFCDNYKPTAFSLLKHEQKYNSRPCESHDILLIFKLIENYFYNVNRYEDKLSKSLEPLTRSISKLKGLCFKVMSSDSIFWKAYASDIVFNNILTLHVDHINQWFKDQHLHHSVRLDGIDSKDLFNALALAQKLNHTENKNFSANDRVVLLLKFCGNKYNYKDQHEQLFKIVEKHNKEFPKDLINLNKVKKLCDKAFKDHENKNKEDHVNNYWSCDLTGENFYKNDKDFQKRINKNKPKKKKV